MRHSFTGHEARQLPPVRHVPESNGAVPAGAGQKAAVRGESERFHVAGMPGEGRTRVGEYGVPQPTAADADLRGGRCRSCIPNGRLRAEADFPELLLGLLTYGIVVIV